MTDQIILNADLRERTGSNKARVIRNIDDNKKVMGYPAKDLKKFIKEMN